MKSFEFLILFFSFAFALALTHLLFAATRMIRHRRSLIFSWPHALWMATALMLLLANWLSLFDFRSKESIDLPTVFMLFALVIMLYFACALVSPDFEEGETYDMPAFHEREGRTYIGTLVALMVVSFAANIDATHEGVAAWGAQNTLVALMIVPTVLALLTRNRVVQILCPLALLGLTVAFMTIFYPVLN